RAEQQVEEVEAAGVLLQLAVPLDDRPELVAQAGCQVGAGAPEEVVERGAEPRAALEQLGLREASRDAAEAGPLPVLLAAERQQVGLEAVVIAFAPDRLPAANLFHEARDLGQRLDEVVARISGGREVAEGGHLLHERVDRGRALESRLV